MKAGARPHEPGNPRLHRRAQGRRRPEPAVPPSAALLPRAREGQPATLGRNVEAGPGDAARTRRAGVSTAAGVADPVDVRAGNGRTACEVLPTTAATDGRVPGPRRVVQGDGPPPRRDAVAA